MNRRTLLGLGAAGVAVSAVGAGAYLYGRRQPQSLKSDVLVGAWQEVGGIQWLLPNLRRARKVVMDRPHRPQDSLAFEVRTDIRRLREFRVNTSASRLRGPAFEPKPAAGVKRILSIGDSVTFGWGVEDEDTWPARLQVALQSRGHEVEVLNAGVPAQQLPAIVTYLQRVAPSLGLHGVCLNRRPPPGPLAESVDQYARAVRAVRQALPDVKLHVFLTPVSTFDPFGMQVWARENEALQAALAPEALTETTPFLQEKQRGKGLRLQERGNTHEVIDDATGKVLLSVPRGTGQQGLAPELYAWFEANRSLSEGLFFDGGHPTAEGNDALGGFTADILEERGWFSG